MKKIIINSCYGGFGTFSEEAVNLYKQLGGQYLEFKKDNHNDCYDCSKRDYKNIRTDSILIQVIEQLGDKAAGPFSFYEIVRIPDDFDYDIEDCDGIDILIPIPIFNIDKIINLSKDREALKQYFKDNEIRYKEDLCLE